jgi:hypothetical protein
MFAGKGSERERNGEWSDERRLNDQFTIED